MAIKAEDVKLIMGMIREEVSAFAKKADSVLVDELFECKQALDGANKNVFKLQAQITALKELMINNGAISRQTLFERENAELDALVKISHDARKQAEDKELAGAMNS